MLQLTRVRFVHRVLLLLDLSCFSFSASYLVTCVEGVLFEKDLRNGQHAKEQRLALNMPYGMVSVKVALLSCNRILRQKQKESRRVCTLGERMLEEPLTATTLFS